MHHYSPNSMTLTPAVRLRKALTVTVRNHQHSEIRFMGIVEGVRSTLLLHEAAQISAVRERDMWRGHPLPAAALLLFL